MGQSAMAIVDAHGVYGAPRFHMAAGREGIRALIGAEVESTEGGRYTLLAENRQGYQNLCRLITRTKLRHGAAGKVENPMATQEEFADFAEGLVCLTGGQEGVLAQIFAQQRGPSAHDTARKHLESLKGIYGSGNVYAELQRHHRRKEEVRNQAVVALARSLGLKLLATNGVSHAIEAQRELQDVLTCVRHKTTIAKAGRLLELQRRVAPEILGRDEAALCRLARKPSMKPASWPLGSPSRLQDLGYEFPRYPVPDGETRCHSCASVPMKARAIVIGPIATRRASRLSASWR